MHEHAVIYKCWKFNPPNSKQNNPKNGRLNLYYYYRQIFTQIVEHIQIPFKYKRREEKKKWGKNAMKREQRKSDAQINGGSESGIYSWRRKNQHGKWIVGMGKVSCRRRWCVTSIFCVFPTNAYVDMRSHAQSIHWFVRNFFFSYFVIVVIIYMLFYWKCIFI